MPGRDPGGFVLTILLGIAGALIGGFVGQSLAARGEMVLARVKSGTQHATHTDETRPRILTRA
jgi:uncharacterized membrane protein YeaQ/YmgE (transglycosylase-associated protein family)